MEERRDEKPKPVDHDFPAMKLHASKGIDIESVKFVPVVEDFTLLKNAILEDDKLVEKINKLEEGETKNSAIEFLYSKRASIVELLEQKIDDEEASSS